MAAARRLRVESRRNCDLNVSLNVRYEKAASRGPPVLCRRSYSQCVDAPVASGDSW